MHKKNIALIGLGYWGKNWLRVLNQFGVLKLACDIDKNILKKRKREYPKTEMTADFNEILKDKDIKGVIIATPSSTHYNLAKRALRGGKDVLVEKPMSLKLKEGEELLKLAEKKKRILMVNHIFLYHPALPKIKEIIKKGRLGKIYYIYSNRVNLGIIRDKENVLWSVAPHDISLIIDILKRFPNEVRATGEAYLNKKNIDIAFIDFKFNEVSAKIFISWLYPLKERKLIIVGSKGMVVFDDLAQNKLLFYEYKIKCAENKLVNIKCFKALKTKEKSIRLKSEEPLKNALKHFLDCLKNRKTPKTDGKEACQVLKILETCQKSINKNGKTIKI